MEDQNAGRSMHCVFVLVSNDRHFALGRTNHRVSYPPGKANRYPPSKEDHIYNRRVGILSFKVKNKRVSAWSKSCTRQGYTEWRISNLTLIGH